MKFRSGDLEFNATVADASTSTPARTGDPLRSLTIQFRAQKAGMHEQLLEQAEQRRSGGLFSIAEADEPDLEWRVRESRTNYIGTQPWGINHHVWLIEQVERLACQRLIVGSVDLEPYEYVEAVDAAGVIRLAARAAISEADLERVSRMHEPVEVTRVGISNAPRRMCVSYVWGTRSESLSIALAATDEREPRVDLSSSEDPMAAGELADLVSILQARGLLAEADLDELRSRAHAKRRVSNVDDWSLET